MRQLVVLSGLVMAAGILLAGASPVPPALQWAYPHAAPASLPSVPPGPQRVPGSALVMTQAAVNDELTPPDWFPAEHPPAPAIVAHGHGGGPTPCGNCHLANGAGFIGAPDLAGLPAEYILEQITAFRAGLRQSAEPGRKATAQMIGEAGQVSDADVAVAAAYFAGLPRRRWVRVVENATAPASRPDYYGWRDPSPGRPDEKIAGRIIELPEDWKLMVLEDAHSGVVAYVPPGSVAQGAAVVRRGACAACHGPDFRGVGNVPPLAGRSPSYLARMLWDIRSLARTGPTVAAMQAPVRELQPAEMRDAAAYLASLPP